jgi:hypothetical protein
VQDRRYPVTVNGNFPILQPLTWDSTESRNSTEFWNSTSSLQVGKAIGKGNQNRKPGDFGGHALRIAGAILLFGTSRLGFRKETFVFYRYTFNTLTKIQKLDILSRCYSHWRLLPEGNLRSLPFARRRVPVSGLMVMTALSRQE